MTFFKPLRFIFKFLLFKPLVKLYGVYILSLKKLREFNQRHQNQYGVIKKFSAPIVVGALSLILITNNLISKTSASSDITETMYTAPAFHLVTYEFDITPPEELITETAQNGAICVVTPEQPLSENGTLVSPPKITTNTVPTENTTATSCLTTGAENILKPIAITTENGTVERADVLVYSVKVGDSVASIAQQFGLNVSTVLWGNGLAGNAVIHEGEKLKILPTDGVLYKVANGDSLNSISEKYGAAVNKILSYNGLDSNSVIQPGQEIIIPGGKKITPAPTVEVAVSRPRYNNVVNVIKDIITPPAAVPSGTRLQWPTVGHMITQYFSAARHPAIDIANHIGTPVYAAADGIVEKAGWNNGGYGNMILLDHPNGMKTRYGHASKLLVSAGETVKRGQVIMLMGSTGHSTGPHVHFEVYVGTHRVNPLDYVR